MTKMIWKFTMPWPPTDDRFSIEMPRDARILSVQTQFEQPCMWALVHQQNPKEIRKFRMAGTGHPIDEPALEFVGTFQLAGGSFVGHLFEVIER